MSTQPMYQPNFDHSHASRYTTNTPAQLDVATLAERCALENERFQRGQPSDPRFAHELFRRALADRDDIAWEYLFNQYRGLVERWVRNNAAFENCGEDSQNLVAEAFARFWRAIPADRFGRFPTAAALLHYLQLCASCVVIDNARARTAARVASEQLLSLGDGLQAPPDEEVIEHLDRAEFWGYVAAQLNNEAERVVVFRSFIDGMKPRQIYEAHQDLFSAVKDVYLAKRNVLDRLRRDGGLSEMAERED